MGAALGGAGPTQEEQDKITEITTSFMTTFGTNYAMGYTLAIVEEEKEKANPKEVKPWKLEKAPKAHKPLKEGMLIKSDPTGGSWKNRYFVAHNEEENFRIDYYDGTKASAKPKGSIECAGYKVEHFTETDKSVFSCEHGINLVPTWNAERRRTYRVKCATKEDREQWMKAFETCCYKARAPRNEDELAAQAFDCAYDATREDQGIWGWYASYGTEFDRLTDLILSILEREVVGAVIERIPGEGKMREKAVEMARSIINTSVIAIVSPLWKGFQLATAPAAAITRSALGAGLGPLLACQAQVKTRVVDGVSTLARPVLEKLGELVFSRIIAKIVTPITAAFALAVKGFYTYVNAKIDEASNPFATSFNDAIENCYHSVDSWWGALEESYNILWRMDYADSPLRELSDIFPASFSTWKLYYTCMDKLKLVFRRAVYTFGKYVKTAGADKGPQKDVLKSVTAKAAHDCKMHIKDLMCEILVGMVEDKIDEEIIKPGKETVAPVQEVIEGVPGMSLLIDLGDMLQEVVEEIRDNAIEALVSGSMADINHKIDEQTLTLDVMALRLD